MASPEGTPVEREKWTAGELNRSCVGTSRCLAAHCKDDTPSAGWDDVTPLFKTALVGFYVRSAPFGGSDRSSSGHRYDPIPLADGTIDAGMSRELVHYVHEEHDTVFQTVIALVGRLEGRGL